MPVSPALENSAIAFNKKYACAFNFAAFEARITEFSFLRPNNGWMDAYRAVFDGVYKKALEAVALGTADNLDCEGMLDDFEYTLIKPYVKESEIEIKYKPYAGMERMARLEYLNKLTEEAPSNPVEMYIEKYKKGELTLKQMKSKNGLNNSERDRQREIAGYVQALENVSKSHSSLWRTLHPFKSNAEKKNAMHMKKTLISRINGGEEAYAELIKESYETFDGYKKVNENLAICTARAREEIDITEKMNDVMRESLRLEEFEREEMSLYSLEIERKNPEIGRSI